MKRIVMAGAVMGALVLGVGPAGAAQEITEFSSIDCRSDYGPAVDTICKSSHLRYLDEEIAERFTRAYDRATSREKARLLSEQRAFLVIRDGCGTDAGCIGDILHHRTDVIGVR